MADVTYARLPERFAYLFWNANIDELDEQRDGRYLASRLLMSDDVAAWGWAARHLSADDLASAAGLRHATPARKALARNLAASRSRE
jgi:hypothetical protein